MPYMPTGTVTFLFTDIEGSTARWEQHPEEMREALTRHNALVSDAIHADGGYVFKTMGDAFCAAFHTAAEALHAAWSAQRALAAEFNVRDPKLEAAGNLELRVRMALHTGAAEMQDGDYFGQPLNRVARLLSAAHGGQTLLSQPTYDLVRDHLPPTVTLLDLGEHRLKDLQRPERVFQLVAPGLPELFSPLRTLDTRPNNLPFERSPLIGREKELSTVGKMLLRQDVGMLTLTGPGGTGKTRLALQVAAEVIDHFQDGVFFVNLAPIVDPALVLPTAAQALGIREAAGQPMLDTLKSQLHDKEMLLLLDNFEQVISAAPEVAQLVSACPRLKALATSRVPLRVRGEHEYAVPSLSLPNPRQLPPIERLTQYEAVRLFIERAQAVKSDFEVTNDNAPAVAEICARLDGLPLAIELAAARIRLLTPQAMLSRLQSRLKLLTGGARDVPARQQTLRGAIEWSYDLLDRGEQMLFRRLAVFVGGRTLEAIEAVCGGGTGDGSGALPPLEVDVLDGVEALIGKSLLRQEEGVGGEPRYVMLETIHEYAREKLEESGEGGAIRRQHAEYFLALAREGDSHMEGPQQAFWLSRMDEEHDNFRAALRWAQENGDQDFQVALAGTLGEFWFARGYLKQGREWLENVLFGQSGEAVALPDMSTAHEALALERLGVLRYRTDDYTGGRALLERCVAIYRELNDALHLSKSLGRLSYLIMEQGDYEVARELAEESLVIARRTGNKLRVADALIRAGSAAEEQGDHRTSEAYWAEAYPLFRALGNQLRVAHIANLRGEVARTRGDYALAEQQYNEALALSREFDHKPMLATMPLNLGYVMVNIGRLQEAEALFRESLLLSKTIAYNVNIAVASIGFARLAATPGEDPTKTDERAIRGAVLLGAAEAILATIGAVLTGPDRQEYERAVEGLSKQLDEQTLEEARARGRTMSVDEVVEYALEGAA